MLMLLWVVTLCCLFFTVIVTVDDMPGSCFTLSTFPGREGGGRAAAFCYRATAVSRRQGRFLLSNNCCVQTSRWREAALRVWSRVPLAVMSMAY